MLQRARDSVHWLGIKGDMQHKHSSCEACKMCTSLQHAEALLPTPPPKYPKDKRSAESLPRQVQCSRVQLHRRKKEPCQWWDGHILQNLEYHCLHLIGSPGSVPQNIATEMEERTLLVIRWPHSTKPGVSLSVSHWLIVLSKWTVQRLLSGQGKE